MTVGYELTATHSDGAPGVSVVAGTEEATQKSAEEHVPATTAGKLRIRNIVVLNTAGVYSIASQTDVRPWCTGGTVAETKEEGKIGAGTVSLGKLAAPLAPCVFRTGDLRFTALSAVETGWLVCEGQEVSRTTYAALFAAIGTTYGAGNGTTTFNVPNYIERVPMGAGATNKLGAKLGAATVALTIAQLASHSHGGKTGTGTTGGESQTHTHGFSSATVVDLTGGFSAIGSGGQGVGTLTETGPNGADHNHSVPALTINAEGSGEAHNNIQPSTICNVWIKT